VNELESGYLNNNHGTVISLGTPNSTQTVYAASLAKTKVIKYIHKRT